VPIVTHMDKPPGTTRVLLVDDDDVIRTTVGTLLAMSGFEITTAASVRDALKLICSETFDVVLSDLHMPGAGDGLTVISAMRHANPKTITILLSAFPQMSAASQALVMQADEILFKPLKIDSLMNIIRHRVAAGPVMARETLHVAEFLSQNIASITQKWLESLQKEEVLSFVQLTREQRCAHLPQLFRELANRLQEDEGLGTRTMASPAAALHGAKRFHQGYSASMVICEFRILQASIFQILKSNLERLNVSGTLTGVMMLADEMDAQLSHALTSLVECALGETILARGSVHQVAG
jgi:CheY-like chemotaxis protein